MPTYAGQSLAIETNVRADKLIRGRTYNPIHSASAGLLDMR